MVCYFKNGHNLQFYVAKNSFYFQKATKILLAFSKFKTNKWTRDVAREICAQFICITGWQSMQEAVEQVQRKFNAENKLVICPWGTHVSCKPQNNC
jgi:hypothetical protein